MNDFTINQTFKIIAENTTGAFSLALATPLQGREAEELGKYAVQLLTLVRKLK